VRCL